MEPCPRDEGDLGIMEPCPRDEGDLGITEPWRCMPTVELEGPRPLLLLWK